MKTHTVQTPDGAELAVRNRGKGRSIVLVSGLGGTSTFWDRIGKDLSSDFNVVSFDQRGIAASTRGTAAVTIAQLAKDVMIICDSLGIYQASFLGHSTGGCIVQTIAAEHPERVEHLILSATWCSPGQYMKALFEARLATLEWSPRRYVESSALLSYPPEWMEHNWDVFERAVRNMPTNQSQVDIIKERITALLAFDGSRQLDMIKATALIIGAKDDAVIPSYQQEYLHSKLKGSTFTVMDEGGHFYPVTAPDRFLEIVRKYLSSGS